MSIPMTVIGKNLRRFFAILLLLFCHAVAWTQLSARFTASPSLAGCSPLVINFSDASTGNPLQWKWDLGNGVISLLKNPSATYFNPGTYTVKLIVRNAGGVDSIAKINYITVFQNPSVSFSADRLTGCFPLTVNFTDLSTPGSGAVTAWIWDFGDGTTSTQKNPSHVYAAQGNYAVTLKITNSLGCTKIFTRPQYISVVDGVTAKFINSFPGLCPAPAAVSFTNTSTGPGPLSYTWTFGDGSTGATANPSHSYGANGTYSVMLIATSPQGCTDTIRKNNLFTFTNIRADFIKKDTVCLNDSVTFLNTSSPQPPGVLWNFGNGTLATTQDGTTKFSTPGTYFVKMVSNFGGCFDSISKQIFVTPKPKPAFDATTKLFCSFPATVSFTNLTTDSGSVLWDFGDGFVSSQNNPTHIYNSGGNFTITLTVTNAAGCSESIIKTSFIQIQKTQLTVAGLPRSGCTPIIITPTVAVTSGQTITNYLWSFGDGTSSTLASPSHTYTATGNYTVKLIYTTSGGCTDSLIFVDAVRTGTKPKAAFTVTPKDVCALQPVSFIDNSTDSATQWVWDFGDGGSSVKQNPIYQYSDTGWFNVQLIVFNNTCPDTLRILNAVHIKPPIARFTVQNSCTDKYTKSFIDGSIGATSWFWTFGDGTTSNLTNPVHTYAATGMYQVTLMVSNGQCSNVSSQAVKVINEKAAFTSADTIICRKKIAGFSAIGMHPSNIAKWQWNFGDGTSDSLISAATHGYTSAGNYTVSLITTDLLGCVDTATLPIKIYGATAGFSVPKTVSCLSNNLITFTDLSVKDSTHPIIFWKWNFGDGTVDSSGVQPYQHMYNAAGNYTVSLLVKDNYGCIDSSTMAAGIIISQPKANFFSADTVSCTGKPIQFSNLSVGSNPQ
ncbi:MAG: PKD domain-containing protein, partial [Bacteroidota bacterium]|nr:PKD domain-containing protein [Bacteroidota bacterium]